MYKTITINQNEHSYLIAEGYLETGQVISVKEYEEVLKKADEELMVDAMDELEGE